MAAGFPTRPAATVPDSMPDHDDRNAMSDNDSDLHGQFNAQVWAERFVKRVTEDPAIATSEGAMLAWFAGAIMTGFDHARSVLPPGVTEADLLAAVKALMTFRTEAMGDSGREFYAYPDAEQRNSRTLTISTGETPDHELVLRLALDGEFATAAPATHA